MSENILPMFFSRTFMVPCHIFRSLSHFKLILCKVWGCVLTSLVYVWLSSFSNTTCWRDCLFPILYSCLPCQRLMDCRCVGLFWVLCSVPLICTYVFVPIPHCFDYSVCVLVAQLCLTLCDPTDCSLPGSSVCGILQARILEWVANALLQGLITVVFY